MIRALIYLMIGIYLFGNFSVAFAEPHDRHLRFQQKNRSAPRGHKPQLQRKSESSAHAHNPQVEQRPAPRGHNPQVQQRAHSAPQVHNPQVRQSPSSTAPRVNSPHVVPQHRTAPNVHQPRGGQKYRPHPRAHQPRVWGSYQPFPRVVYPHRHPHGHRVVVLPHGFISLTLSGLIYYYAYGNFYRDYSGYYTVVTPPIGALIPVPPPGYRVIYIDSQPYYLAAGVYYIWDDVQRGYRVIPPPQEVYESSEESPQSIEDSLDLFVYPKANQSENEQANDRYECHLWAAGETDFDPSSEQSSTDKERSDFKRAITACLEARDYTVR